MFLHTYSCIVLKGLEMKEKGHNLLQIIIELTKHNDLEKYIVVVCTVLLLSFGVYCVC